MFTDGEPDAVNSKKQILVPRFADTRNLNAQNLNAKSLLTRFHSGDAMWSMIHYDDPLPELSQKKNVNLTHLLPRHLWMAHLAGWYQKSADAIFYPGIEWPDEWGLWLRANTGR